MDVCGDKLTCYFLGTRLNSALPIPVPLLRFLPPQSHCDMRGKAKERCLQPLEGTLEISGFRGGIPVPAAL